MQHRNKIVSTMCMLPCSVQASKSAYFATAISYIRKFFIAMAIDGSFGRCCRRWVDKKGGRQTTSQTSYIKKFTYVRSVL